MMWERLQSDLEKHAIALREVVTSETHRQRLMHLLTGRYRKHTIATGAVVIAFIVAIAIYARPAPAAQDPDAASKLPAVVAAMAHLTRLAPQIPLAGTVVSRNDSHLAADVEGRVAWVADVGTVVAAGDVVAKLDSSVAADQLASDKANVARLGAQLRFDRAQAERMENLYSQSAIAKATRDQAVSARDMDSGALSQAQAALAKSQFQFDHDQIRAPFAGRVVARLINPGEYATAGKEILRLVDTQALEISAQAPIDATQFIHEGMPLISLIETRSITAPVRAIVPVGDQLSRTVEIRLTLSPGAALVGDSAKVMIPSAEPRNVVAVPRDALLLREDATYLFKLDKRDNAIRIAVETGSAEGNLIEVRGAITPGERVVVRGAEHLEAGQKVRPVASL
jgi:RND family efflux transporter MFP subunit